MKNYTFPFDIEAQIASITNVYRAGMGLAPIESSLADSSEALHTVKHLDNQDEAQASGKASGDVVVPFRKREE